MKQMNFLKITVYILPALLPLYLFWFLPIFVTLSISFTDWDYMSPWNSIHFLGFRNYTAVLCDERFYQCLVHTMIFSIGTVGCMIFTGFLLAQLVYEKKKDHPIMKFLLFSPWVTPMVTISIVWVYLLDQEQGLINQVLHFLNIRPLPWLTSSKLALISVMIVTIWKSAGYAMVIILGGLQRIPETHFEAAAMDGANALQRILYISIPEIRSTLWFLVFTGMVSSIRAYDQIQILTQGGPSGSTRTLIYYFYQLGFEEFDTGKASATSMIILMLTVGIQKSMSKIRNI